MAAKCVNHPIKAAIAHCKRCNDPLCVDCRYKAPEGIFCSDECVVEFREFRGKVYSGSARSRSRFSIFAFIKYLIIVGALCGVIWFVLVVWLETEDPGEMLDKVVKMFKVMF